MELGFIDRQYNIKEDKIDENNLNSNSVKNRLKTILDNSNEYFKKVIGRSITNVELHKYYNYLLGTSFRRKNAQIFPFHTEDFSDLEYIIIGKEEDLDDYCYFLYEQGENSFKEKTMDEIKQMLGKDLKVAQKYEQYIKDNPIYEYE